MNGQLIESPNGYTYIEYEDGTTNIDGLKIKVNDQIKNYMKNTGGLVYDMFEPVLNDDVDFIYIMYVNTPIRGEIVAIHFVSDTAYNNNVTGSGTFMKYITDLLNNEGIDYEIINTLDTINENPDFHLEIITDNYVNPTSVDGIGIFIDDREIKYGDCLVSLDEEHANRALKHMCDINESFEEFSDRTYPKAEIEIRTPHMFGWDIAINLYEYNGKQITYGYTYCAEDLGRIPTMGEFAIYQKDVEIDISHKHALKLNKEFDKNHPMTDSQKRYAYDRINPQIDYGIDEELHSPYSMHTNYHFLELLFDIEVNFTFKD